MSFIVELLLRYAAPVLVCFLILVAGVLTGAGWLIALRPEGWTGGVLIALGFVLAIVSGMFLGRVINQD